MNSSKYTVALIGAGHRGKNIYGNFIKKHCSDINITAVAEPNLYKRKAFAKEHNIPYERQYKNYEQLFEQGKIADALLITTMDHDHYHPTIKGLEIGYKILLEKPIAPNFDEFQKLVDKTRENRDSILIAHVLRYTPFYKQLKETLNKSEIGDIKAINHTENVGYYHFVHSYVRGNWRNESVSAPLALAKSSHDFDLLTWLLNNKKCKTVFAQGKQNYFIKDNHPYNAGKHCNRCEAENNCPYSAKHIYLSKNLPWPKEVVKTMPPLYQRKLGVKFTDLGKCVYLLDNTMPEVITANLNYQDNIQVNFTLNGLSKEMTRVTKIYGTKGEIRADFAQNKIQLLPFRKKEENIEPPYKQGAHGGGDLGLMEHFESYLKEEYEKDTSTLEASIESHIVGFAVEQSRRTNKITSVDDFRTNL
ncbi:Gfo/Idh/MocA family protein [Natranaerobius trueperi]|uniref:Gfo/Idh/MocA family protein n=1 Tax=Natranaerobius trueperi TaxID=759412 RepID=UPI00117EC412|nr:Gfo/Idh/MocA family oxidoreductase [Natranaerobius trueperi]